MDLELLQLAIKSLSAELQEVKQENKVLAAELKELKRQVAGSPASAPTAPVKNDDELIPIGTARSILNVSKNIFLSLVRDGILKPVRINLRTIRYSRVEIQRYIERSR